MFLFSEWKFKEDLEDDSKSDTVEFSFKNTFIFDEMMTLPLTGEEIITMPHLAMLVCLSIYYYPID
jgi:hypothetical protein